MISEAFPKNDLFRQRLRLHLDTLEEQLLEVHAQALWDTWGLNRAVPRERDKLWDCGNIANGGAGCTMQSGKLSTEQPEGLGEKQRLRIELSTLRSELSTLRQEAACSAETNVQDWISESTLEYTSPETQNSCNSAKPQQTQIQHVVENRVSTQSQMALQPDPEDENDPKNIPELKLRSNWLEIENVAGTRKSSSMQIAEKLADLRGAVSQKSRQTATMGLQKSFSEASRRSWKCYIDPFSKRWMFWEIFGFLFLMHDVIYVPMLVFDIPPSITLETLKLLIMSYWTLTCFFTFFLSYQHQSEIALITDRKQIVRHYVRGWFALDFAVISCDWASFVIDIIISSSGGGLASARMARMARLGRIFRTARLLRVMRIGEMLLHVKALIDSEWTGICFLLACNVAAILCLAHLTACIWFGIGNAEEPRSWLEDIELAAASFGDQYLHSLGWSLSTLLGSAVSSVRAVTTVEFTCALLILVVGTILISLVFSSTTAAMTRLHELQSAERQATWNLKTYLKQNNISTNLKARVIRYVDIAKSVHSRRLEGENVVLLNLLSGPLRLELQLELHSPHLILNPFFQMYHNTNATAMSEICWSAVGFMFLCRCDSLFQTFTQAKHMYFVVSGTMVYRRAKGARDTRPTAKIDKRESFCEAALWTYWIHRGGMKALIESQILALEVDKFCQISELHHDVFLKCCDYARRYLERVNDQILSDGYVWDVDQEVMYPDKYNFVSARGSARLKRFSRFESPHFVNMLREAEELGAELMDVQSDSDSDDERMLHMALKHQKSNKALG